jgi:hypothetical protein
MAVWLTGSVRRTAGFLVRELRLVPAAYEIGAGMRSAAEAKTHATKLGGDCV